MKGSLSASHLARSAASAAARAYLEPLIRGEAPPPYGRDGIPKYVTLKNVAVKKKLPAWEG